MKTSRCSNHCRFEVITLIVILMSACASPPTNPPQNKLRVTAEQIVSRDMALAATLISDTTVPIAHAQDSLKQIKSPSAFAKVALESDREPLVQEACLRIKDEHILHQLLNNREVTNQCTEHALFIINDSALLTQLLLSQRINGTGLSHYHRFMRKIKDMSVLEQIAKQYPYESIRYNAQSTLAQFQLEQKLKKVSEATDDNELMSIALQTDVPSVWVSAMMRISSQDMLYQLVLKEIHSGNAYNRNMVIERITDQALLAAISVQHKTQLYFNLAFNKITDEKQLYEVARAGIDPAARLSTMATTEAREAATKRIVSQPMLTNIAVNDPHGRVRAAALGKIHDQPLLIRVATQGADEWERTVATSNLLDRSTLKALTKKSKRQASIANLRLALLDVDSVGAIAAVKLEQILISQEYRITMGGSFKVGGEKVTVTIQNTSTGELFPTTTKTIFSQGYNVTADGLSKKRFSRASLTEQNLVSPLSQYLFSLTPRPDMSKLATTTESDLLRAAALKNVTSKQLIESAYNDPNVLVRKVIVERLTNQLLLEQLAQNDTNTDIRSSAVKKINDKEILLKLSLDKEAHYSVRHAAIDRLKILE